MNATSWGLLLCIGFVAAVLAEAVRRLERRYAEALDTQQRAFARISALEADVKDLRRRLERG